MSYDAAVNHAMLYEVGGFWNLATEGAKEGLIETSAHRRACGYVNDPTDRGGETKYGVAKTANPDLNIATLDWEAAKRVYQRRYWLPAHCDQLEGLGLTRLAALHFDSVINHGVGRGATFLQRAAGAEPDGDIGPATLNAAKSKGDIAMCNALCDIRADFYRQIVEKNPPQAKYLDGWLRRINEMRAFTTAATFV
jgi:lysozyme family protein